MKSFLKLSLKQLLLLLCCLLCGTLLMILAYLLPVSSITSNLARSESFFAEGVSYPEIIPGYPDMRLDQFTDCLMLLTAGTSTDDSIAYQAMNNAHFFMKDRDPQEIFVDMFKNNSTDGITTRGYARYWHGYLTVLKPLLTVFRYQQIVVLNLMLQMSLLAALCVLYTRNGETLCILPLLGSYFFLSPVAIALSIQYSSVWIITLIALLLLALWKEPIVSRRLPAFFLIVGATTSFFDLLTYPLITLGLPLAYLVLTAWPSFRSMLRGGIAGAVCWGLGYGGMWAGKWLLGGMITGKDIVGSALSTAETRSSFANETGAAFRYRDILVRMHVTYNSTVVKVLIASALLAAVILLIRKYRPAPFRIVGLLIVCSMPFVWYAVFSNHSIIHYWFTYRTLSVAVYSLIAACTAAWLRKPQQSEVSYATES